REASVRRVVLEEVGEVRSGHEVVDRDDFDVLALRSDAVNKSADSAETVDCNFDGHRQPFPAWVGPQLRPRKHRNQTRSVRDPGTARAGISPLRNLRSGADPGK